MLTGFLQQVDYEGTDVAVLFYPNDSSYGNLRFLRNVDCEEQYEQGITMHYQTDGTTGEIWCTVMHNRFVPDLYCQVRMPYVGTWSDGEDKDKYVVVAFRSFNAQGQPAMEYMDCGYYDGDKGFWLTTRTWLPMNDGTFSVRMTPKDVMSVNLTDMRTNATFLDLPDDLAISSYKGADGNNIYLDVHRVKKVVAG